MHVFFFLLCVTVLKMSGSRIVLNDLEIISELEEIFGLPDDPNLSDDNLESDEEEAQYSTT